MRLRKLLGIAAAVVTFGLAASPPAAAFGWHTDGPPAGWGTQRVINHWIYNPRFHHIYRVHDRTDPYAYQNQPRGYYPYYGSHYWRAASEMRQRRANHKLPTYHAGWGYPKDWQHGKWHAEHHGFHHRWHW